MYVYEIRNLVNNRIYVGQTRRKDPQHRWGQHKSQLERGKHPNPALQNAWRKYGADSFRFSVVVETDSADELNSLEISGIECNGRTYNLKTGGQRGSLSEESRDKLRRRFKGIPLSEEHKAKLRGPRPHARIVRTPAQADHLRKLFSGIPLGADHCTKLAIAHRPQGYPVLVSPSGEEFPNVVNLSAFSRSHGLTPGKLALVVNGKRNHHKGWTVKARNGDVVEAHHV